MTLTLRTLVSAVALLLAASVAQAQLNVVKMGVTRYTTHSTTSGIQGIGVPAGADATTGDATTLLLVYERLLTPNVGVELAAGVPPRIHSDAAGTMAILGKDVLSAKNVAPTLLLNYHFGAAGDTWRPYVGIGVNFTRFVGIRSSLAPDVRMSDSVGPAVQAGIDFALNNEWTVFASVAALKVKSDLVAVASTVLTTTIDFKPIVYSMGLSRKF